MHMLLRIITDFILFIIVSYTFGPLIYVQFEIGAFIVLYHRDIFSLQTDKNTRINKAVAAMCGCSLARYTYTEQH